MDIKHKIIGITGILLGCSVANASSFQTMISSCGFHPVVALQGGYASINAGNSSERFPGTDTDIFTYTNSNSDKSADFIGAFLGAEYTLPWNLDPVLFMQMGVEYNYYSRLNVGGSTTAGDPLTFTTYTYHYRLQTQQVLGTFKLFSTFYNRYHPYAEVGLGAAFNNARRYEVTTTETGSLNITPIFDSQSKSQFSYILGLGIDAQLDENIRLGLGYRYSNFGSAKLKNGRVIINDYQAPVSFALGSSNLYANQLIAHITYTF